MVICRVEIWFQYAFLIGIVWIARMRKATDDDPALDYDEDDDDDLTEANATDITR